MSSSDFLAELLSDLRYGVRMLAKSPTFTVVAVFTLALGIGANTAIFSLIDDVLLRLLPIKDPEQLVLLSDPDFGGVWDGVQGGVRSVFSYNEFRDLRKENAAFADLLASQSNGFSPDVRIDGGAPEEASARLVTGNYFAVLGVNALRGRTLTEEDDHPGAAPAAVISDAYWQRRFGRAPAALGRRMRIGNGDFTVIGVTPPGFFGEAVGTAPDVWLPLALQELAMPGRRWLEQPHLMFLHAMGRLRPGVNRAQAQASLNAVFHRIVAAEALPGMSREETRQYMDQRLELRSGSRGASGLRRDFAEPLLLLMAAAGLVLIIACANVANLLLARAATRQREISVRLAVGASTGRILRQLLTESVLLSFLGAAAGLLVAFWVRQALLHMVSNDPQGVHLDLHLDRWVLGFTALLALLTGVLFGLAPALRSSRAELAPALKESSRGMSGGSRSRFGLRRVLVVMQVALSVLLLVSAGLFLRSLQKMVSLDLGYSKDNLLVMHIDPTRAGYTGARAAALYRRLLDDLTEVAGVRAVTLSENGLFSGTDSGDEISVEGYKAGTGDRPSARFDQIAPGFFRTLGVRLALGREFETSDSSPAPRVAIVNEAFVKKFFRHANPIGRWIRDEYPETRSTFTVVGVSPDLRDRNLRGDIVPMFYLPFFRPFMETPPAAANVAVRIAGNPATVAVALRRSVERIDGKLSLSGLRPITAQIDRTLLEQKLIAKLSSFFGLLALVLACVGLYGVMAYTVTQRTKEMGVRMALGASRGHVLLLTMRDAALMIAIGLALGTPAAAACGRLVRSRLFGVSSMDLATLVSALGVMAAVALMAAFLAAQRAAGVDPVKALNDE